MSLRLNQTAHLSQAYAYGFDEFVTTWPPATNTTNIDDKKSTLSGE